MSIADRLGRLLAAWTTRSNAKLVQPADDLLARIQVLNAEEAATEAEAAIAGGRVFRVERSPAPAPNALTRLHLAPRLLGLLERFSLIEEPYGALRIQRSELAPCRIVNQDFVRLGTARGEHALLLARPGREEVIVFDPADNAQRLGEEVYPTVFHLLAYATRQEELD